MLPRKCNVNSIKLRKLKKIRIHDGDPIKGGTPLYRYRYRQINYLKLYSMVHLLPLNVLLLPNELEVKIHNRSEIHTFTCTKHVCVLSYMCGILQCTTQVYENFILHMVNKYISSKYY